MTGKTIGIIVVVIVILGALWYFFSGPAVHTVVPPEPEATTTGQTGPSTTGTAAKTVISYTDSGFSPASISITQGQTVTWTNNSSEPLWVASDPHPEHSGYDGTTRQVHCAPGYAGAAPFDECTQVPAGGTFSFTFDKVGTWGYHNHADDGVKGTVIVTAPAAAAGVEVNVQ